jgi:hypothetical protein
VDEPLTELAAYFRRDARLPDQELIRLTAAARAGGSQWDNIAAACGIKTYNDLGGVIYRFTGGNRRGAAVLCYPARGRRPHRQPALLAAADLGMPAMRATGHRPCPKRTACPHRARPRPGLCPPRPRPGRR